MGATSSKYKNPQLQSTSPLNKIYKAVKIWDLKQEIHLKNKINKKYAYL